MPATMPVQPRPPERPVRARANFWQPAFATWPTQAPGSSWALSMAGLAACGVQRLVVQYCTPLALNTGQAWRLLLDPDPSPLQHAAWAAAEGLLAGRGA